MQAADDDTIGRQQSRFQRPQNCEARMQPMRGAQRDFFQPTPQPGGAIHTAQRDAGCGGLRLLPRLREKLARKRTAKKTLRAPPRGGKAKPTDETSDTDEPDEDGAEATAPAAPRTRRPPKRAAGRL